MRATPCLAAGGELRAPDATVSLAVPRAPRRGYGRPALSGSDLALFHLPPWACLPFTGMGCSELTGHFKFKHPVLGPRVAPPVTTEPCRGMGAS